MYDCPYHTPRTQRSLDKGSQFSVTKMNAQHDGMHQTLDNERSLDRLLERSSDLLHTSNAKIDLGRLFRSINILIDLNMIKVIIKS